MIKSSLFLCGFMGCGKSTVGRILAKSLAVDFIDLDSYIEKNEGRTIPEIFEKFGEGHFRELESTYLDRLSEIPAVIATGGGALISEKNAEIARRNGIVIFINTSFEECYSRIKNDEHRPIVRSKSESELRELYNFRENVYKNHSDIIISGENTPAETALSIQKALQKCGFFDTI